MEVIQVLVARPKSTLGWMGVCDCVCALWRRERESGRVVVVLQSERAASDVFEGRRTQQQEEEEEEEEEGICVAERNKISGKGYGGVGE